MCTIPVFSAAISSFLSHLVYLLILYTINNKIHVSCFIHCLMLSFLLQETNYVPITRGNSVVLMVNG